MREVASRGERPQLLPTSSHTHWQLLYGGWSHRAFSLARHHIGRVPAAQPGTQSSGPSGAASTGPSAHLGGLQSFNQDGRARRVFGSAIGMYRDAPKVSQLMGHCRHI